MRRRTIPTLVACGALALACQACAQTGLPRPGEPLDTELGRFVRRVRGDGTTARVEQHGSKVTVRTTRTCDLQKVRVVDRMERVALEDERTTPGVLVVVGGGVSLLGVVVLVVAVGANDSHLATEAAIGGGITAAGLGLITGGFLAQRRAPTALSLQRIDLEDGMLKADVPCRDVPNAAAHEPVTGRAAGPPALELPLGDSDAAGVLEIDLAEALPPALLRDAAAGATMAVFVRERAVGAVRLDEAALAVEAEAWAQAGAEVCATGSAADACSGLERYLRALPSGLHAPEAREALARGKATLPARVAAAAKARAAAAAACRQRCQTGCKGAARCTQGCVAQSCR